MKETLLQIDTPTVATFIAVAISDGVILPPPVEPIARPPKEGNWQLKLLPPMG